MGTCVCKNGSGSENLNEVKMEFLKETPIIVT